MSTADLLVVAGGAARRLAGVDKTMLLLPDGRPVLAALIAAPVSGLRIVVGPRRDVEGVDVWAREDPPGGGPAAAIAAGLTHVVAGVVVVLAGDLPFAVGAVPALLRALDGHDAAAVEADGRTQWLLAAWRTSALRAAIGRLDAVDGARVRSLYDGLDVATVADGERWSGDLDTPADLRRLLDRPGADDDLARGGD